MENKTKKSVSKVESDVKNASSQIASEVDKSSSQTGSEVKKLGNKREMEAYVVSDKMDKTVVVQIKKRVQHPVFKKYYTVREKYKAHDEDNACHVGDKVLLRQSRPLSREKRWVVIKILEKAVA